MTATTKWLSITTLLLSFSSLARAQDKVEIPSIYYPRADLPLSSGVLVERMTKFEDSTRAETEKAIAAKRADVIAALTKELLSAEKAGDTKAAAAIQKQIDVWKIEEKARQEMEQLWATKRAQQAGAAWKLMVNGNSMERWTPVALPDTFHCSEGTISVETKLMGIALHPCGSADVVVRGKMLMEPGDGKRESQAGIGFQVNPKDEGVFLCLFQEPGGQSLIYGGFKKGDNKLLDSKSTKTPTTAPVEVQVAMVQGALMFFVNGRKVNEFKHPELGTPANIVLFGNNTKAQFKDLEMLSPTKEQVEGLLSGRPVK
jgi:hypothetical protein